ncbi:MAG: ion transporter [Bacteroidales bacterium]|nr:ion transporter [Candidatus Minthousia equi]MDO4955604.1 ion transporter [Bacteroidales bacterium]
MAKQVLYSILEGETGIGAKIYNISTFIVVIISLLPLMCMESQPWFTTIEIATTILFVIDYLARWYIADLTINKSTRSYMEYPFHIMAIIDVLSILPAISLINPAYKVFRCIRLIKIFRVFKLLRLSRSIVLFFNILKLERRILFSVLLIALLYIFVTALIMFNVEPKINPETGAKTFTSFFDAIYWATVTLTTVGYGDLCPVTDIGRCISMISSLFGVAVIALPSGVITARYLDELREARKEHSNKKAKKGD